MRKRNASDFTDDLKRDVQCGAVHFGFHIWSIIVRAHKLQVLVELIDKPWIIFTASKRLNHPFS
jgi:hypothetical protein